MGDKTFPNKISLGARAVGWLQSDIDEWIEGRIKANMDKSGAV